MSSIEKLESPKDNQIFIWFAKSVDDTILTEFEDDGKENKFDDIDKENLKEFGLLGRGVKLRYLVDDGIINISGNKIEFYLEDDAKNIIKISDRESEKYNDIIQYKGFYQDFAINTKDAMGGLVIDSYHFGYKHVIKLEEGDIYVQVIYRMPMGQPMKIGIRLAPTFDLKSKLFVTINSKEDKEPIGVNIVANRAESYEKYCFF